MRSNLIAKPLKQVKTDMTKTIAPRIHVFSIFTAPHVTYWLVLLLVGTVGIGLGKVDVHTVSHQT